MDHFFVAGPGVDRIPLIARISWCVGCENLLDSFHLSARPGRSLDSAALSLT
ncbi:hypothetical protein LCGC14_0389240 [marine sediment metagenome]|uniref:Uncharacterized protein n=1 Tax=marine sediment metagenome TaxID=412755 RepID=A0A0F9W949_9ZZZZ